jgi:hypothetical protein
LSGIIYLPGGQYFRGKRGRGDFFKEMRYNIWKKKGGGE